MDLSKVPEFADFMIGHQVYLNPTMLARYGFLSERAGAFYEEDKELLATDLFRNIPAGFQSEILNGDLKGEKMSASERQRLERGLKNVNYFVREFSARGGLLLAATDTGDSRVPGISMHRELQLLVDAGVTPYRALLGATRFPAELMKKADSIGTVQEGRQADVLLISSNPLENIAATRDIRYVIRKGIIQRKPSQ